MKYKVITYGEFRKRYNGFNRMRYERSDGRFYRGIFADEDVTVSFMYNPIKDYTIVAFTPSKCMGFLRPDDDYQTILYRYEGRIDKVTYNETHKNDLEIAAEECSNWYKDHINKEES